MSAEPMAEGRPITSRRHGSMSGGETVFHFVGYDADAIEEFDRRIGAASFDFGEPEHRELDDAVLAPMRPSGPLKFSGGVVDREGSPWPFAQIHRRGQTIFGDHVLAGSADPGAASLDVAFYGGAVFNGYGHMILESIARITPRVAASREPIVFHLSSFHGAGETVFRGILETLGIAQDRVVFADGPIRVRRLIAAEPGLVLGGSIKAAHIGFLRSVAAGIGPGTVAEAEPRPIYLSRSKLSPRQRTGFGEAILEDRLGEAVRIVHPQTLPLREQIRIINSGRRFLGLTGSQMHNLLFHQGGRRLDVVHLASTGVHPAFFQLDLLTEGDKWYVNAADYGRLAYFGLRTPFTLDFAMTAAALRLGGFMDASSDLDVPPMPSLERDFHAAWFSAFARHQIIRRLSYCPPEERDALTRMIVDEFRHILDRAPAGPEVRAIAETSLRPAFAAHAAAIPPDEADALLRALLAP